MRLDREQEELLVQLVEAARSSDQRQPFWLAEIANVSGLTLIHPGWKNREGVFAGDLDQLVKAGLIAYTREGQVRGAYVTPHGFDFYRDLHTERGEPLERTEDIPLRTMNSSVFRRCYPEAHAKWQQAEALLWANETEQVLSAVGHHLREALQLFADTLVRRLRIPNVVEDRSKTIVKIRAALEFSSPRLGRSLKPFLAALISYWGELNDLVQRQEHAAQREGEALVFVDAQRIVLHSAVLMHELFHCLDGDRM